MKKLITLLTICLLSATAAFAQNEGDMYAGGSISLGAGSYSTTVRQGGISSTDATPMTTTFSIAPTFGYFIADNMRVSASLGYGLESSGSKDNRTSISSFLIGPEFSYYVCLADNFYYTPEIGIYGGFSAYSQKLGSTTESTTMGAFGITLNFIQLEMRPIENISFSINIMSLEYVGASKTVNNVTYSSNNVRFNFDATIGVRYYF